jgi:HSP20 family molecular chaperone IbpA
MAKQEIVKEDQSSELETSERTEPRYVTPAVDIYENDQEYLLLADLPGVEPSSLSVQLEANELRMTAKKSDALKPRQIAVKAA